VRAACVARKRDPNELTLSLRLYLDPAGQMEPEKSIAGMPAQMRDRLAELAAVGVSHVVLDPVARGGVQGRLDAVRAFMRDVVR
jgi:hypothetical protein